MIGKIIKKNKGTLSSPKKKTGISRSQIRKPSPYVEQPHRVTIPIEISTYSRSPSTTVQVLQKPRQWISSKKEPTTQPTDKGCNMKVCQWYRQRKAKKQLALYNEKEKKRRQQERIQKERQEIEQRAFEHFKHQDPAKLFSPVPVKKSRLQQYHEKKAAQAEMKRIKRERKEIEHRAKVHYDSQFSYDVIRSKQEQEGRKRLEREKKEREKRDLDLYRVQESYISAAPGIKLKKYRRKKVSEWSYAKPRTTSKAVKEKKLRRYDDDLAVRFTNCFYRFCCQMYCCISCILIIGFVVIVIL